MKEWIENELTTCKLKDKRLEVRLSNILERFSDYPLASIPASCRGWSETQATYRLLNNERIEYNEIIQPHIEASKMRLSGEKVILMINDTTSLDFTGKKGANDLGYIENKYKSGLFLHPTIAITPERLNLGLIDLQLWSRANEDIGKKKLRKQLPFDQKESYNWFKSYEAADKIAQANPSIQIISIGDRENDIYEIFLEASKQSSKADLLIRSCQDRKIALSGLLWQEMENSAIQTTIELHLPKTEKRLERDITMTIQYKRIVLQAPYRKNEKLENIKITALLSRALFKPPRETELMYFPWRRLYGWKFVLPSFKCTCLPCIGTTSFKIYSSSPTAFKASNPLSERAKLIDLPADIFSFLISGLRSKSSTSNPRFAINIANKEPESPPPTINIF